jgi:RHS repeat-associated protein
MFKRVDGGTGGSGSNCASPDGMFCARFEDSDMPITTGTASKTTYYVGNVEFIREGMVDKVKRYIGNYLVITNIGINSATYDYLLRDSLGSIDTIASENGVMKSRQSFNAHGQRRTAAAPVTGSWNVLNPLQISLFDTSTTTQGYTGHEQLDGVGLVHMGARLYDPELGRFIQADDFVEPEATQGLNRYSYVLNNPLSNTDPTGNFNLRQALGVVVGVVAAIFTAGLGVTWVSCPRPVHSPTSSTETFF